MGKNFDPQKYDMVFCSVCNGKGKLLKSHDELEVCRRCGGFGFIKKESEILEGVEDRGQIIKVSQTG